MNHKQFVKEITEFYTRGIALVKTKNRDYAGENNPWRNFDFAQIVGVSNEKAQLVRMSDKLARISNLINTGVQHVPDEKIEDTLLDLANYSAILATYIKYKKRED